MRLCADGSPEAFAELFERYRTPICRYFQRRVREAGRAEDLAQDTFVAVFQAAIRYEPRSGFRSYLFGVAFNVLASERRRARAAADPGREPAYAPEIDAGIWVRRALEQLDEGDREIVMLREFEDLQYDEIAGVLRIPVNTVRSRLFRARLRLRAILAPSKAARA